MDETRIQFKEESPPAKVCATCGQRFSSSAQFCPFDGEPLVGGEGADSSSDDLVASVIDGRYEVLGVIGEGGMGRVYEVKHVSLERKFALKVLKSELADDADLGLRFIQEAKAAAHVNHSNIVQITDFGQLQSGQPFFVMELLEGESLSTLIRRSGPLPFDHGLTIAHQVAEALAVAHDAGIIHRDLKPDNVCIGEMLGRGNIVKVLDFGLAKVAGASRLTRQGMVFGTPHYMSPEQALSEPVDARSDVYALGILMYEMFTGKVPFESDTFMGVLSKHMHAQPTPPTQVLAGDQRFGALEPVILKCLAKKPDDRYPDMLAVVAALEAVARRTSKSDSSASPHALDRPSESVPNLHAHGLRSRRILLAAWFGGSVALGVLLAVALHLSSDEAPRAPATQASASLSKTAVPAARPAVSEDGSKASARSPKSGRLKPTAGDRAGEASPPDPGRPEGPSALPNPKEPTEAAFTPQPPPQPMPRTAPKRAPTTAPSAPKAEEVAVPKADKRPSGEIIDPWAD